MIPHFLSFHNNYEKERFIEQEFRKLSFNDKKSKKTNFKSRFKI